ncbi:hypothetical protein D1AOALGA4SA_4937 [Olavius algarvensis Delta 1 endosymbiont]|nr:hypothetical protein D1AOALGA4SA_4937 [Olavius algarvensis Delta 1 endosymbiont]
MSKSSWGVCSIILCAVFAVALTVPAHVGSEVFVVSSSINGDANYMFMTENGKFDRPEILQQTGNTTINLPFKFSYGNGLGDFNNDGLLDYILAMGWSSGDIYISEKLDVGNQFGEPIFAGNWGLEEEGGFFPMDLAVADYNEDGNADFVLSLDSSSHSGLYLGDGAFGFSSELLPASAPYLSAGADAADFNNDGHADFVIAPRSDEPFFVSLGDGTGKFTTTSFASYDGGAVWGVAAADFTGNGNADIVAAYYDFLYVYEGAGDGVNFTYLASYELPFNQSAIDNHDFNDDGLQDLVVASYDMATGGVAVFLGQVGGTFLHDATYEGGTGLALNGVSAQPWEPVKNMEPVAVIQPENLEFEVGEEIVFDGSGSYDEDGQIDSYEWDFGDAAPAPGADDPTPLPERTANAGTKGTGVNPSHIYQASGTYLVSLLVVDDKGSTASVQAEVVVHPKAEPAPLAVKVKFYRYKHFRSWSKHKSHRAKYLRARIEFPEGYDAHNVERASVCIVPDDAPAICAQPKKRSAFWEKLLKRLRKYRKPRKSVSVKFDGHAVMGALVDPSAAETELTVKGKILHNGEWVEFEGTGDLDRLKRSKKKYYRKY